MKIKSFITRICLAACLASSTAMAQEAPKIAQLGIDETTTTKALADLCARSNQTGSLNRMVESLNEHLLVAFQSTKKFRLIAKGDMGKLLADQQIPVGLIRDPGESKSLPGKIKGLDYLLVATLTDFIDAREGTFIEGMGMRVDRRTVRATSAVKIFDASTGALLSAVTIPVAIDEAVAARIPREGYNTRTVDDSLIEAASISMAQRASVRVVDVLYPARVLAITDDQVTINRGEGSGIDVGQIWEIFALGKAMVDPDTGISLGREEVKVGEITVTNIMPNFSKGTIRGNNRGIDTGAVARPVLLPLPGLDVPANR